MDPRVKPAGDIDGDRLKFIKSASRAPSRIDDVAQPVAQKIEAEHGHH
jgi:hypothetical protein